MRPNEAETAVYGCHCPGNTAVRMRKVLARPWVGFQVCHLLKSAHVPILGLHRHAINK